MTWHAHPVLGMPSAICCFDGGSMSSWTCMPAVSISDLANDSTPNLWRRYIANWLCRHSGSVLLFATQRRVSERLPKVECQALVFGQFKDVLASEANELTGPTRHFLMSRELFFGGHCECPIAGTEIGHQEAP